MVASLEYGGVGSREMPHRKGGVDGGSLRVGPESTEENSLREVGRKMEQAARLAGEEGKEKDELLLRIESLLSDGLADAYSELSPEKKISFRAEGEELALWLQKAVLQNKINPHRLLVRMERWLLIVENKHRYSPWLIQEAYVRARRVLNEIRYDLAGH